MSTQRSLASPHSRESTTRQAETQARLLRILLIGPELRVEELQALLADQEDMALLPTIADLDQALDVLSRMNGGMQIDVALVEWESSAKKHFQLLQTLARRLHCLVIASPRTEGEVKHLEEAGAYGYCSTAASSQQLVKAIRTIARGSKYFRPMPTTEPPPPIAVKRRPVFVRERLEEYAASWQRLSEIELLILAHFDAASVEELARRISRPKGTVRNATSGVFIFLQHISDKPEITNRMVAFQALLELGIFEYR